MTFLNLTSAHMAMGYPFPESKEKGFSKTSLNLLKKALIKRDDPDGFILDIFKWLADSKIFLTGAEYETSFVLLCLLEQDLLDEQVITPLTLDDLYGGAPDTRSGSIRCIKPKS